MAADSMDPEKESSTTGGRRQNHVPFKGGYGQYGHVLSTYKGPSTSMIP